MSYTNGLDKPSDYFTTKLYVGNGGTQTISGVGFEPDWTWIKVRSTSDNHSLEDQVRGANKTLKSDTTGAEFSSGTVQISSWNSDGFALGSADGQTNGNGQTYASWNWKAGGSASSNSNGSITSSVSANQDAGFSIGTYNGSGSDNTVGHGLGVAPDMIIVKCKSTAHDWVVYHSALGNAKILTLNATTAAQSATGWQSTSPTSTVFSIDNAANSLNQSGQSFVFYAMASKKGYSKFGSYVGNGASNGTFCHTGIKPAFVMIKATDATKGWVILDNKRNPSGLSGANTIRYRLFANTSAGTSDNGDGHDFYSNGFKHFGTDTSTNQNGTNYIYMAFAENPFVTSTGIPATAR